MSERVQQQKKLSARDLVPMLIIGVLGVVGVVLFHVLGPGLQFIEMLVLFLAVGFIAIGYRGCIIRGLMTLVMLYIATGVAATYYKITTPYVSAPFGGEMTRGNQAWTFIVLTLAIWILLEVLGRIFLRDTTLPGLRSLDNVGGVFTHALVGILVAVLLFNTVGYSDGGRRAHNAALLRPEFNRVLSWYTVTQSFWFRKLPTIYMYDLDLSSEP